MGKDYLYPLRRIHGTLHELSLSRKKKLDLYKKYRIVFVQKKKNNPKTVFLVLTPEHSNLGDHAIAFAETELLKKNGIDYVEITGKVLTELQRNKCLSIMNGHPILINGGGNLGTLWYNVEQLMRDIITANPKSQIFILPNTIYYEDTSWGRNELERSKTIYNSHKKLSIYARERISLEIMQGAYRSVKLIPDMVLSLDWSRKESTRAGCLLCLRNDHEKLRSEQEEKTLYNLLQTVFNNEIHFTDMHAAHDVPVTERERALAEKCMEFRSASLVVTDRLHGMILCAITGTPCIVINSRSPKVKGCYEWVKHLEYIRFCDNVSDVLSVFHSIPKEEHTYDNSNILWCYEELIREIAAKI